MNCHACFILIVNTSANITLISEYAIGIRKNCVDIGFEPILTLLKRPNR